MTVSRGGGGEDVAQIGKEDGSKSSALSGERTYHVKIDPDVDQALVLALTVILEIRCIIMILIYVVVAINVRKENPSTTF